MTPTTYQTPEIRDANDNIIQQGAFGKNTALANATNDGWIDYVANDLEFLYGLAKDEIVPVPSLPASGQMNKTYLLTTTGVSYRWSGTQWVAVSSSEAVGRAESAANLAEQWATKTSGTVDGTEYSAKYYAQQAEASADDAQDVADDMADHLVQIDKNTGGVSANSKRISNIEKLLQGNLYDYDTDDDVAYTKTVPSGALPYAGVEKIGGKTVVWNQLVNSGTTTVATISGHKYYTLIDGTASIVTSSGSAITIVDDSADMVCDLTLMLGSGNEPSTVAEFEAMFPADYYPYNVGTLLSAGVTEVKIDTPNIVGGLNQGYLTSDGTFVAWNTRVVTDYISVAPLSTIECSIESGKLIEYITMFRANKIVDSWSPNYNTQTATITVGSSAAYIRITYRKDDGRAPLSISEIQNAVAIQKTSYSIPADIQALVGYGRSAGNVYNYVNFNTNAFVKNVSMVDLGTLTWVKVSDYFYSSGLASLIKHVANNNTVADIICSNYVSDTRNNIIDNGADKAIGSSANGYTVVVRDTAYASYTVEQFKTAMSGVILFYGLQVTIETDISQYLTDNLIEVGAGGTLTFENSNGDDYHIPVPSTETYMIDLQEAISNG